MNVLRCDHFKGGFHTRLTETLVTAWTVLFLDIVVMFLVHGYPMTGYLKCFHWELYQCSDEFS
jgi:hypothetical protein